MRHVEQLDVAPFSAPAQGAIVVPGSKSLSNRALLLAALAQGKTQLKGILKSDDTYWCIDSLQKLGIACDVDENTATVQLAGGGVKVEEAEIFFGSAGTLARFLPALLATGEGTYHINASAQLCARPLRGILKALEEQGTIFEFKDAPYQLPFTLKAQGLKGGEVMISGALSSQFISALMMAAPLAKTPMTIRLTEPVAQPDYLKMTQHMMADFGVKMHIEGAFDVMHITPQPYQAYSHTVEADTLAACNFLGLAAASKGDVTISNFNPNSLQPGVRFLDVLEQLGCTVEKKGQAVRVQGPEKLKGGLFDMSQLAEATLTLAAMAPFADAPIEIRGVEHIRHHECDRLSVMAQALVQAKVPVKEFEDGLYIAPKQPQKGLFETHDDHRVAMALAIMGAAGQGITLNDPACVSKTCPTFFELLKQLT